VTDDEYIGDINLGGEKTKTAIIRMKNIGRKAICSNLCIDNIPGKSEIKEATDVEAMHCKPDRSKNL
jgi:hypothetical protein